MAPKPRTQESSFFLFSLKIRMIFIPIRIRTILSLVGIAFCLFTSLSCEQNKTPLTTAQPQISLSVEDVLVTEAWLNIKVEQVKENRHITLWRDTTEVFSGTIRTADTTLYDSVLLPNRSYTYRAALRKNGQPFVNSETVQITTMDTTSHDFTWQTYTIESPFGSGLLQDVIIINENDVWAVGAIAADSAQPSKRYNAVHWDGSQWGLKRIPYVYNGQPYYHPMNFAFSFENGEVWFGGNGIVKWNGNSFSNVEINQNAWGAVAINKMWGSSTNNVFIVGNEGSIAHYNGSSWQKIVINTDLDFQDIWGAPNNDSGEWQIIAVASKPLVSTDKLIVQLEPQASLLTDEGINGFLETVRFSPDRKYYLAGSGIYQKHQLLQTRWEDISQGLPNFYRESIRGNELNDIFLVGHFGLVSHWNGIDWRTYPDMPAKYYALAVKGDLVVAVGQESAGFAEGSAAILMGRRN